MKYQLFPLTVFLLGLSTTGQAMTYDFAAEGNQHEAGYSEFNSGDHSAVLHGGTPDLPGGLTITASNGGFTDGVGMVNDFDGVANTVAYQAYHAYMDANSSSEDAGLGVCQQADGNCAGISDDNQTDGEFIHMVFDEVVNILSLDITGDHTVVDDKAEFWYSLDGGVEWHSQDLTGQHIGANIGGIADLSIGLLFNKTLDYTIMHGLNQPGAQMYLSSMTVSAVPVPAAVWLFGTALISMVGFGKRSRET
ncbi:MAG: hypothetical protein LJE92_07585 [Gammaproteobacteria bacterium]|nr:hypothetical protein [Gammaproteobacteria bacterium]